MSEDPTVLVVDDLPQNARLLDAVLGPRGYRVGDGGSPARRRCGSSPATRPTSSCSTSSCRAWTGTRSAGGSGRTRATAFLPVVMITASGDQEKRQAIEAGADDFVTKPFDQAELLARVRSLVRIKRYHDTIERQTAELTAWNQRARAAGQHPGARSWNGWAGSGASSRPSSPTSW